MRCCTPPWDELDWLSGLLPSMGESFRPAVTGVGGRPSMEMGLRSANALLEGRSGSAEVLDPSALAMALSSESDELKEGEGHGRASLAETRDEMMSAGRGLPERVLEKEPEACIVNCRGVSLRRHTAQH